MTQLHAARYLLVPALLIACGAATAADEAVRLVDITPRCGDETLFKFDGRIKACVVQPAELEKLNSPTACKAAPGVKWTDRGCVATTLEPSCGSQLPNLVH